MNAAPKRLEGCQDGSLPILTLPIKPRPPRSLQHLADSTHKRTNVPKNHLLQACTDGYQVSVPAIVADSTNLTPYSYLILLSRQGKVVSNLTPRQFKPTQSFARLLAICESCLLISNQRLAKWFTTLSPKEKSKIVKDVSQLVLARRTRMCNFLEYKGEA